MRDHSPCFLGGGGGTLFLIAVTHGKLHCHRVAMEALLAPRSAAILQNPILTIPGYRVSARRVDYSSRRSFIPAGGVYPQVLNTLCWLPDGTDFQSEFPRSVNSHSSEGGITCCGVIAACRNEWNLIIQRGGGLQNTGCHA